MNYVVDDLVAGGRGGLATSYAAQRTGAAPKLDPAVFRGPVATAPAAREGNRAVLARIMPPGPYRNPR